MHDYLQINASLIPRPHWTSVTIDGLFAALKDILFILAANRAYAVNVGISSVIISLPISMIIAFLFSRFAPRLLEHHSLNVYAIRFTAAAVMIVCALQL